MESLRDYSLNITEEEYHALPAWSYSLVARYAKEGFSAIATIHEPFVSTPSMEFGSLFDALITDNDNVVFRYATSDVVPPPAEKSVFDYLLGKTKEPFAILSDKVLMDAITNSGYYTKYKKYDTQYAHLSEFSEYYDIRRGGRKVVSQKDMNDAMNMAAQFRHNPFIAQLFDTSDPNVECLFQLKFKAKIRLNDGRLVPVKCMPDAIIVNHNDKTVQPVDIKTSAMPAFDFAENFIKYRYDIQASMYDYIIRLILNAHDAYKDYTMLPYIFCDISRSDMQPVSYVYDVHDPSQVDGFSFKEYKYKGWKELLGEIIDYEESHAVVPSNIKVDEANDLITLLNAR